MSDQDDDLSVSLLRAQLDTIEALMDKGIPARVALLLVLVACESAERELSEES